MASATISIDVDPETARAFSEASEDQRSKLKLLLKLRLRELTVNPARSLTKIMDEMGQEAKARGLTPELLESLLHGE
jgi:hypothetical protein